MRDFRLAVSTTQSVGDVDGSGRSVGIGVSWLLLTTADYGLNDQPEKGRPKTNVNASRDDGCGLGQSCAGIGCRKWFNPACLPYADAKGS